VRYLLLIHHRYGVLCRRGISRLGYAHFEHARGIKGYVNIFLDHNLSFKMKNSVTRKRIDRCNIVSRCNKNSNTQPTEICCKSLDSEQIVIFMVAENCPAHSYTNSLENYQQSSIIHTTFVRHNAQHSNSTTGICVAKTCNSIRRKHPL
jgi:hypothetical protein